MDSDRRVIENGWVEITDGIISAVESGSPEAVTAEDINGNGRTVYPGFIDIHTHLGLSTSGVGMEGEDFNEESEPCTAHIRIVDGINPIDYSFELARKAGVTCCLVSPGSANPVAGSIAAVKTYGKRIDKMLVGTVGMKFSMGENPKLTYSDKEDALSPVSDETDGGRHPIEDNLRHTPFSPLDFLRSLLPGNETPF